MTKSALLFCVGAVMLMACEEEEASEAPSSETEAPAHEDRKGEEEAPIAPDDEQAVKVNHDEAVERGGELEGERVAVTAVSWGTSKLRGGGVRLNLGAEKLDGMRQPQLVADFEQAPDGLEKNTQVALVCTMGTFEYGARQLDDCEVQ